MVPCFDSPPSPPPPYTTRSSCGFESTLNSDRSLEDAAAHFPAAAASACSETGAVLWKVPEPRVHVGLSNVTSLEHFLRLPVFLPQTKPSSVGGSTSFNKQHQRRHPEVATVEMQGPVRTKTSLSVVHLLTRRSSSLSLKSFCYQITNHKPNQAPCCLAFEVHQCRINHISL